MNDTRRRQVKDNKAADSKPVPAQSARKRSFLPRLGGGTLTNPGPDLGRMAVGLDARGVNLAEGLRAAFASASLLVAGEIFNAPLLAVAAIGAQLTCFCDTSTSSALRRHLPPLVAFAFLGGLVWGAFGILRGFGLAVVLPLATAVLFFNAFARVWGLAAQAAANILTIVLAITLDETKSLPIALVTGAMFALGGAWAVLLTAVIWRIRRDRPGRLAVAETWQRLAELTGDLRQLLIESRTAKADWEGHARAHRRAVRDALERARTAVSDMARSYGPLSPRVTDSLLRLETAEQIFGALIGLSDVVEHDDDTALRRAAEQFLRMLRPLLVTVRQGTLGRKVERAERFDKAVDRMLADIAGVPELSRIAAAIGTRLKIATGLATTEEDRPAILPEDVPVPLYQRIMAPVRANLTWNSATLRHALRAAAVGGAALAVALVWPGPFQHWLVITVVLTMQPYFAATWQRALERIAGTFLGALIGAALAFVPQTPLTTAALLVPLSIIGFGVRQVSYGAYVACLTPMVVLLVETVEPGESETTIALMRLLFTLGGGIAAVLSCLVLWPTWEPDRVRDELRSTLKAYAGYAEAIFAAMLGSDTDVDPARRAAGVAHNNLEASLSRALQEPHRRVHDRLDAALVVDATLRRFGGALQSLRYDPAHHEALASSVCEPWADWLPAMLRQLADRHPVTDPPPEASGSETLTRLGRQIELIKGALPRT